MTKLMILLKCVACKKNTIPAWAEMEISVDRVPGDGIINYKNVTPVTEGWAIKENVQGDYIQTNYFDYAHCPDCKVK